MVQRFDQPHQVPSARPSTSPIAQPVRQWSVALSAVLKIAQHAVDELLAQEWGGVIAQDAVAKEHDFNSIKLAGLFNLSSEIAEDLEVQEDAMRARAKELRLTADAGMA